MRTIFNKVVTLALLAAAVPASALLAQEHPAQRLSSIVGVAVEEYAKGIDARGQLISDQEYQEAVEFLADARSVAERLPGDRAPAVRAVLDTLSTAMAAKQPPQAIGEIHKRFVAALGSEGALELPRAPIDLARGRQVYTERCASCHGERGIGDGPAARG
ncbi:MAG: c-type cytochrome, partial [Gemmatimonadaceae bacterium]|nr:c-type cytochrome [Gemmatimonadaceae bacterium]